MMCYYLIMNVPYNWINNQKSNRNCLRNVGKKFLFPGGRTMFPHAVGAYIDLMQALILGMKDGTIRTAIDTGYGLSGVRRLRDAIVLGYKLQRAPGRDLSIPDWYTHVENELGHRPAVPNTETNDNGSFAKLVCQDLIVELNQESSLRNVKYGSVMLPLHSLIGRRKFMWQEHSED